MFKCFGNYYMSTQEYTHFLFHQKSTTTTHINIPTKHLHSTNDQIIWEIFLAKFIQIKWWWKIIMENMTQGLLLCLVGVAVGQFSEALLETSTPVPILRFAHFFINIFHFILIIIITPAGILTVRMRMDPTLMVLRWPLNLSSSRIF